MVNTDPSLVINNGDNAWMMTSAALVFLMTPGLAFFYAGFVPNKNALNTMFMSMVCMGIVMVQWFLFGYSFAFDYGNKMWGTWDWGAAANINEDGNADYSPTWPLLVHFMYQGAFAVITPALISGAVVGRMKLSAYLIFVLVWTTAVYDPLAHWVWSSKGWLRDYGAIDFAGGTVVHMSAGFSALVAAVILGARVERQDPLANTPANVPFIVLGTALLWIGWYGFNAGSAGAANGVAAVAFVNTTVAPAGAMTVWIIMEYLDPRRHHPTISGACVGAVVGLATVTPASGYVFPGWGMLIGIIGAFFAYGAMFVRQKWFSRWADDTLDVFGCHGIGGAVGTFFTGVFSNLNANSAGFDGAIYGRPVQMWYQIAAMLTTIAWSCVLTAIILLALKYTIGITEKEAAQHQGLDSKRLGEVWVTGAASDAFTSSHNLAVGASSPRVELATAPERAHDRV